MDDPIKQLEMAKANLISVEDVLLLLMDKYNCSIEYAAEILLAKLPEQQNDFYSNPLNPPFFGKKIGIARFSYIPNDPNIYQMLEDVIAHNDSAFDCDIPF